MLPIRYTCRRPVQLCVVVSFVVYGFNLFVVHSGLSSQSKKPPSPHANLDKLVVKEQGFMLPSPMAPTPAMMTAKGRWHSLSSLPIVHTPFLFFGCYSGRLLPTFSLTIASMRANKDCCTFIVFHMGDEEPEEEILMKLEQPSNVHFVHASEKEFEEAMLSRVGVKMSASVITGRRPQGQKHHKWNDIRVASPKFFAAQMGPEVEFWGYMDLDCLWKACSSCSEDSEEFRCVVRPRWKRYSSGQACRDATTLPRGKYH
eukprot:gnl/MRDRNA2_/MRDRNA2_72137_c0_seq2.p1 gnl/MRDRNA2_/MRDRNA2_72137_c0~~gnl/MRDRNA2_/MRDRNA2_72137_c0_seq2.p1  ORF type:complete len:258 (+),score=19.83 gnl/MRDRNA2_/MRDRNA2_72137_c0_seq2:5-778(+)